MDIIEEVQLPSKGLVYDKEIAWKNRLRAPRLCDKGLGDMTRKNQLQANILDKTLVESLGISAYDLHYADFIYLNFKQRQLTMGNKPFKIQVKCSNPKCQVLHKLDIDLSEIDIKFLEEKPEYLYTTLDGDEIEYTFATPRIFDDAKVNSEEFKETYPETEVDTQFQELLRLLIKRVNGGKKTYSQMTAFISNLYMSDIMEILNNATNVDFGLNLDKSIKCPNCGKRIDFTIPV